MAFQTESCARCRLPERPGVNSARLVLASGAQTRVDVCDECYNVLDDRKMFTTALPIDCADFTCGHWEGTIYYTGPKRLLPTLQEIRDAEDELETWRLVGDRYAHEGRDV